MAKDYYNILGIDKKASKDEIKKAFRNLAHKYHPDKKTGDDAKFKEINEAYSVLSDDTKRSQYDQFGSTGPNMGGSGFDGFDFSQFTQGFNNGGFEFDFGDIFGDVFGGNTRKQNRKGRDISVDIEISFEDSVFGVEKSILINKVGKCDVCNGTGGEKGSGEMTCSKCNGKGNIKEIKRTFFGQFESNSVCSECEGSGKVPKTKCSNCGGHGVLKKETEIKVRIPGGIENGEMMRLSNAGESVKGGQNGDLYIKIYVKKHPVFRKEGLNLVTDLNVKLSMALLGGEMTIKTLDGDIALKIPEGLKHGEILRIKGKGVVSDRGGRGDILLKSNLIMPNKLSKTAKKLIEDLKTEGL